MSELQMDADGFLDMGQFPDDGTDLGTDELVDLRAVLHADPVDEPTAEEWDAMYDEVVTTGDDGPFGLDDGLFADTVVDHEVAADDDAPVDVDLPVADDDALVDDLDADGLDVDDLDVDDDVLDGDVATGLDLGTHDGADAPYDVDGLDVETPADISHDFEDTL